MSKAPKIKVSSLTEAAQVVARLHDWTLGFSEGVKVGNRTLKARKWSTLGKDLKRTGQIVFVDCGEYGVFARINKETKAYIKRGGVFDEPEVMASSDEVKGEWAIDPVTDTIIFKYDDRAAKWIRAYQAYRERFGHTGTASEMREAGFGPPPERLNSSPLAGMGR